MGIYIHRPVEKKRCGGFACWLGCEVMTSMEKEMGG
jgi:hypothetical protein